MSAIRFLLTRDCSGTTLQSFKYIYCSKLKEYNTVLRKGETPKILDIILDLMSKGEKFIFTCKRQEADFVRLVFIYKPDRMQEVVNYFNKV